MKPALEFASDAAVSTTLDAPQTAPATKKDAKRSPRHGEAVHVRMATPSRHGTIAESALVPEKLPDLPGAWWAPVLADNGRDGVQWFPVIEGEDGWDIVSHVVGGAPQA